MLLIILPFLVGLINLFLKGESRRKKRRLLFVGTAVLHLALVLCGYFVADPTSIGEFIRLDSIGRYFLTITSFIFLLTSIYSLGYFPIKRAVAENEAGGHIYIACMLFFLAAMSFVCSTNHVGLLWIAIEATTLASAPLIYYKQSKSSLEAAWKYLLICSVGIAIALLGVFFFAAASKGLVSDLLLSQLSAKAVDFDLGLMRLGFILIMIGFGTKVGLAPLHSWLPDAHSEAPSPVSALLSGTLLNCALLGIIRFYTILEAAKIAEFGSKLLIIFGLASLIVAAIFITRQRDYKRLLAYSSIENMGIIVLGLGVGATYGAMLHVAAHSLTKGMLFMAAGNILVMYRTKLIAEVGGLLRTSGPTGILFALGGMAIVGLPPGLPFITELLILRDGFANGHTLAMIVYLAALTIIFVSMTRIVFKMVFGPKKELVWGDLPKTMTVPPAILAVMVFLFGMFLPANFSELIENVCRLIS